MARPMVVGDRLWLFSQAPNGPASVQSMMLNNGPMPIPPLRNYPAPCHGNPSSGSPILDSARNALLARGQPLNYGLPKNIPPHSFLNSSSLSPGASSFKPLYENSSYKFNPYLPPSSSAPSTSLQFPSSRNPLGTKTSTSPVDSSEFFLQMKYGFGHSSANQPFKCSSVDQLNQLDFPAVEEPPTACSNGLAELERAFGDRRVELNPPGRLSSLDSESTLRLNKDLAKLDECNNPDGSNSDVDCEEIEDDEIEV